MSFTNKSFEKSSELRVHEWLAISIVIGIVGGLAFLTSFNKQHPISFENQSANCCGFDVFIKGAVENPGIFHVPLEIKMKDLLALAKTLPNADLRRYNLDSILKKGRLLNVPLRSMIHVHLKGAVIEEGIIALPKGTKLEELIDIVKFSQEADFKPLRKKRRLKSGEVIFVPTITSPKKN